MADKTAAPAKTTPPELTPAAVQDNSDPKDLAKHRELKISLIGVGVTLALTAGSLLYTFLSKDYRQIAPTLVICAITFLVVLDHVKKYGFSVCDVQGYTKQAALEEQETTGHDLSLQKTD
ncbi:hypothetical protein ACP4OV_010404 [Aristida adscensionis]